MWRIESSGGRGTAIASSFARGDAQAVSFEVCGYSGRLFRDFKSVRGESAARIAVEGERRSCSSPCHHFRIKNHVQCLAAYRDTSTLTSHNSRPPATSSRRPHFLIIDPPSLDIARAASISTAPRRPSTPEQPPTLSSRAQPASPSPFAFLPRFASQVDVLNFVAPPLNQKVACRQHRQGNQTLYANRSALDRRRFPPSLTKVLAALRPHFSPSHPSPTTKRYKKRQLQPCPSLQLTRSTTLPSPGGSRRRTRTLSRPSADRRPTRLSRTFHQLRKKSTSTSSRASETLPYVCGCLSLRRNRNRDILPRSLAHLFLPPMQELRRELSRRSSKAKAATRDVEKDGADSESDFDLLAYLQGELHERDKVGFRRKALGVAWRELRVVGAGGDKVRFLFTFRSLRLDLDAHRSFLPSFPRQLHIQTFVDAVRDWVLWMPNTALELAGFNKPTPRDLLAGSSSSLLHSVSPFLTFTLPYRLRRLPRTRRDVPRPWTAGIGLHHLPEDDREQPWRLPFRRGRRLVRWYSCFGDGKEVQRRGRVQPCVLVFFFLPLPLFAS